jgi:hypothetical protein
MPCADFDMPNGSFSGGIAKSHRYNGLFDFESITGIICIASS